ncbi:MAG: DegT/DnrJ/EryC1/StrS family aminotransferase [Betaproteobacteria bacterium]|nr:DegT/DnrJ/EryC1/StrS family aminotransferase [Betaproteobacteria bacterium]MCL2885633.1 DegT/DnrJ/EryC1/StrS family aminotransferase [Betaproteobacteria bacterium]
MPLDYQVFDPTPCRFPLPRVPVLPRGFQPAGAEDAALLAGISPLPGDSLHYSRGRYALGAAYCCAGLGSGGALLAPAYHCVTMLDPALALGAEVLLYPLSADLAPDPAALDALLEVSSKPVKALLATHFFGFVRDFSWLQAWCAARGIVLIEDCSHTLCTERYRVAGAGCYGRFVASSPYKFFASADGGWLYAPDADALAGVAVRPARWWDELRGLGHWLERVRRRSISAADSAALAAQLAALAGQAMETGNDKHLSRSGHSAHYQPERASIAALRSSRWLAGHASLSAAINQRRANYRRWLRAVADLLHCRPLYPELPEAVVPYMFPLYIEHPLPHFYWLKQLGVPVWRWDEMAVSTCPVARDYRLHLLHLPCHQSLREDEMDWLLAALTQVLRASPVGAER